jgi:hypothetical protein
MVMQTRPTRPGAQLLTISAKSAIPRSTNMRINARPMTTAVQPPARYMPFLGLAFTSSKANRTAKALASATQRV